MRALGALALLAFCVTAAAWGDAECKDLPTLTAIALLSVAAPACGAISDDGAT